MLLISEEPWQKEMHYYWGVQQSRAESLQLQENFQNIYPSMSHLILFLGGMSVKKML